MSAKARETQHVFRLVLIVVNLWENVFFFIPICGFAVQYMFWLCERSYCQHQCCNVHFVLFPSDSKMCFQPVCWNYCSIGPLTDISWLLWTGRYANSHSNYFLAKRRLGKWMKHNLGYTLMYMFLDYHWMVYGHYNCNSYRPMGWNLNDRFKLKWRKQKWNTLNLDNESRQRFKREWLKTWSLPANR